MKILQYLLFGCLMALIVACEEDTLATNFAPQLTTGEVTDIYRTGATISGKLQVKGETLISHYGILFSESQSMSEYEKRTVETDEMDFSFSIENLEPGKTYYYCSYAHSGYSIVRGDVLSFSTLESSAPIFDMPVILGITESSFTITSTLIDDGGSETLMNGFCYNEVGDDAPSITNNVENVKLQNNTIQATISNLEPNKTYQVRAYGTSKYGTEYSKLITITTKTAVVPVLSTIEKKDSTLNSITVAASVVESGSSSIVDAGFCYSTTNEIPTTDDECISLGIQTKVFSQHMENLVSGNTYYIRAYAVNGAGTGYSKTITKTTAPEIPYNQIWYTTTDGGSIIFDWEDEDMYLGGANIIEHKIVGNYSVIIFDRNITTVVNLPLNGSRLKSLLMPNSITSYTGTVSCPNLTDILFSKNLQELGGFSLCEKLETIILPDNVMYLASHSFSYNNFTLKSVTLSKKLEDLGWGGGGNSFEYCYAIEEIHCRSHTPPIRAKFDKQLFLTCKVYVPKGSLELYKSAEGWKDFTNIIEEN